MKFKPFYLAVVASMLLTGCSKKSTCNPTSSNGTSTIVPTSSSSSSSSNSSLSSSSSSSSSSSTHTHNYDTTTWEHDETYHWHKATCEHTSEVSNKAEHTYNDVVTQPTDDEKGYTTHTCTVCNYSYKDSETPSLNEKFAKKPVLDKDNQIVSYGLYPQTHVSDADTITALNALTTAESNGWYLYNDDYYAKVDSARVYTDSTFVDGASIFNGANYWFKCETIKWKILSTSSNTYSLLSTVLLDAKAYDSSSFNYKNSSIRAWLNDTFLNTAFSLGSSNIQTTEVRNSADTTNSDSNVNICENTNDKIYLLSYRDYRDTDYGFIDSENFDDNKKCSPTDYALANYAYQNNKIGQYWTRSTYSGNAGKIQTIDIYGSIGWDDYAMDFYCVRPAMTITI